MARGVAGGADRGGAAVTLADMTETIATQLRTAQPGDDHETLARHIAGNLAQLRDPIDGLIAAARAVAVGVRRVDVSLHPGGAAVTVQLDVDDPSDVAAALGCGPVLEHTSQDGRRAWRSATAGEYAIGDHLTVMGRERELCQCAAAIRERAA